MGFGELRAPNPIFSIFSWPLGRLYKEREFDFKNTLPTYGDWLKYCLPHMVARN